jgi:serine/threonine protein kinase
MSTEIYHVFPDAKIAGVIYAYAKDDGFGIFDEEWAHRAFCETDCLRWDDVGWAPLYCSLGVFISEPEKLLFRKQQLVYRSQSQLHNEWDIWSTVLVGKSSPHVARLLGKIDGRCVDLFFEGYDAKNLYQLTACSFEEHVVKWSWKEVISLWADVFRGLAWLHEHGILHHDVHPKNVLVTRDKRGVLCDLGIAEKLDANGYGNPRFRANGHSRAAPEQDAKTSLPVTTALDIYHAGISVGYALTELVEPNQSLDWRPPQWFQTLQQLTRNADPTKRPTATRMCQLLETMLEFPEFQS